MVEKHGRIYVTLFITMVWRTTWTQSEKMKIWFGISCISCNKCHGMIGNHLQTWINNNGWSGTMSRYEVSYRKVIKQAKRKWGKDNKVAEDDDRQNWIYLKWIDKRNLFFGSGQTQTWFTWPHSKFSAGRIMTTFVFGYHFAQKDLNKTVLAYTLRLSVMPLPFPYLTTDGDLAPFVPDGVKL